MRHRIAANLELKHSPVDLAESEMPHLTQIPPDTHHRKISARSQDPFDFPEIDKRANRVGGKCLAPEASAEHHMRKDDEIRKDGPGVTSSMAPSGYEYPRAPITETVSRDGPVGSGTGRSRNYRNDRVPGRRHMSFNRNQEGQGACEMFPRR